MNRLTDDRTAKALKDIIDKLKEGGFEVDVSNERYVRLAEYEQTGYEPEEVCSLDVRFYALDKKYENIVRCKDCEFVDTLECPMNYIDKQRLIFTNRAPDWFCAEGRRKDE